MTVKIEEMSEERIVIASIIAPIEFPHDVEMPLSAAVQFKEKVGTPVCRIMDFTASNLQFSEMMFGLAGEQDKPGGFWDKDVYSILIGTSEWVTFGVESTKQAQYEGAEIKGLVATREEALALARSLLQK
jgi:hypothetical protein